MQNVYSIFLKDCTMTTVEPANPTKINLNKKRARFWNKADRLTYGRVTNSTLLTSGGNDTVSIDFLDNSLIDLGSGNDRIVISPYTRNFGFFQEIVFDGLGSNVTIDGGTGRDTLSIQAPQAGFQWAWDGAYWQIQQD
jgi:Ca2+-binding RTX toxin-like protein